MNYIYICFSNQIKMTSRIFILLSICLFSLISHAQKSGHPISSGKVIFDISYPDSPLNQESLASMPTESIMLFKDEMVKVEVSMMIGKTTVISDNKSGSGTMLMDMAGKKFAIALDKAEMEKQRKEMGKPVVSHTKESKTIAGYTCKKAMVTFSTKEGEKTTDIWYTDDLKAKNSYASQIEGIEGFMLEFYTYQGGMGMKMTAKSVEPMEIAESEFIVPAGYEKMTLDDLKNFGTR